MRTVTNATARATAARITLPGHLIEIACEPILRLTTRATCAWRGNTWVARDVKVSGLGQAGNGAQAPRLGLRDTDGLIGALALQDGLDDAPVRIWAFDGAALGDGDPVQVFTGAVAGISIDPANGVTLTLGVARASALYAPRLFYGEQLGMTRMVPVGTVLQIGSTRYIVERK